MKLFTSLFFMTLVWILTSSVCQAVFKNQLINRAPKPVPLKLNIGAGFNTLPGNQQQALHTETLFFLDLDYFDLEKRQAGLRVQSNPKSEVILGLNKKFFFSAEDPYLPYFRLGINALIKPQSAISSLFAFDKHQLSISVGLHSQIQVELGFLANRTENSFFALVGYEVF